MYRIFRGRMGMPHLDPAIRHAPALGDRECMRLAGMNRASRRHDQCASNRPHSQTLHDQRITITVGLGITLKDPRPEIYPGNLAASMIPE